MEKYDYKNLSLEYSNKDDLTLKYRNMGDCRRVNV